MSTGGKALRWDQARELAGGTISLFPDEAAQPVELAVCRAELRGKGSGMVQFALVLRGPATPLYPQRTYRFSHPALGELDMFIAPLARLADAVEYEACFSHAA